MTKRAETLFGAWTGKRSPVQAFSYTMSAEG